MHLDVDTPVKVSEGRIFIGSLLQMLKTNYFNRDGYRTLIMRFPKRKIKTFSFAQIISEKIASEETLR